MRSTRVMLLLGLALLVAAPAHAWGVKKNVVDKDGKATAAAKEAAAAAEMGDEESHFWWNSVLEESQWDFPTYEFVDDEGREYFVDPVTKATSWEKPDSLFWEAVEDPEKGTYYFNTKTEESVWEKPAMLAWEQVPVKSEL